MRTSIKLILAFLLFIIVLACQKDLTSMRIMNDKAKNLTTTQNLNNGVFDFAHENNISFKFSTSKECKNSSIEIFDADPILGGKTIVETKFLNNTFNNKISIPAYTNIIFVKIKNEKGICRSFAIPVYGNKVEFIDS